MFKEELLYSLSYNSDSSSMLDNFYLESKFDALKFCFELFIIVYPNGYPIALLGLIIYFLFSN